MAPTCGGASLAGGRPRKRTRRPSRVILERLVSRRGPCLIDWARSDLTTRRSIKLATLPREHEKLRVDSRNQRVFGAAPHTRSPFAFGRHHRVRLHVGRTFTRVIAASRSADDSSIRTQSASTQIRHPTKRRSWTRLMSPPKRRPNRKARPASSPQSAPRWPGRQTRR
jgi:hypothetical protein